MWNFAAVGTTRRRFLALSLAAVAGTALPACARRRIDAPRPDGDAARFAVLLERMLQAYVRDFPESLSWQGFDRDALIAAKTRLDDRSPTARDRCAREQRAFLRELDAIDPRSLDRADAVSLAAVRHACSLYVQGAQFGYGAFHASRPYAVSRAGGAYVDVPTVLEEASHWIATRDDTDAFLSRLAAWPDAIDDDSDRARDDASRGVMPPDFVVDAAVARLTALREHGLHDGSVGARYAALAQDPRHRYPNTDDGRARLRGDLQARVDRVRPRWPEYFGTLPVADLDLVRLPPIAAVLRNPSTPRWEIVSHCHHETLGHFLQVNLALESPRVPTLINVTNLAAFHEGWGMYAERLADAMGAFADDPLDRLGWLRSHQMRAMHLAADTGLHAQGWTRERAIAFVGDVSGLPAPAVANRIDRCCAMPGQGIAFMGGAMHWSQLRERAQQRLGSRFDIRGFHDTALRHGAVPLAVLDRVVDDWIAEHA